MSRSTRRALALVSAALLFAAARPASAQSLSASERAVVTREIRAAADGLIAAIGSRDIARFMALFTTEPDLVYVDNGKIYPSRAALEAAAGGFFSRIGRAGGRWEPAHVVALSPSAGAFTGIFRPEMVDTAGAPLWTDGKIWTFVYERRQGRWVIVQAHEVNAKPGQ
ncbi:MAG: nuclear transport factor 2 family protein [Gemmatimonadetes bacterium]|nr:nuclear transport factor 2 family protein [Gemmatimonadota bacterium]MCC6772289.1 nuclear transport factor 2 family protein [Gemmatimonadaceae bacterium]